MGRKKKLISHTNIPQYAIERFARCVFDDIRKFYDSEERQREFALWKAEQTSKLHTETPTATENSVAVDLGLFLFLWTSWFGLWAY